MKCLNTDGMEKQKMDTAVRTVYHCKMLLTDDARPERNDRWIICIWVKK